MNDTLDDKSSDLLSHEDGVNSITRATPNEWTNDLVAEYTVRTFLSILMVLINSLVLLTIGTTPSLHCPTSLIIASLAVTDLMVGVMGPAGQFLELQIVIHPVLCRLGYAGVLALCSVSINHLLFVSIDRYLLISRPFEYPKLVTNRRAVIFIVTCWVYASLISIPFAAGVEDESKWNGECRAELLYPLWLVLVLTVLHFVLPLVIMIYVYINIFLVARRQRQAVNDSFRRNGEKARGMTMSTRAKLRSAQLLALPCGYFYVSWGPWFATILWAVSTGKLVQPHGLERLVQALGIVNSLGNPILYAVSQPALGRAMWKKLCCILGACQKEKKHLETITLVPRRSQESDCTLIRVA